MANETRDRALELAALPLRGRPQRELATLTGEAMWLMSLSQKLGRPLDAIWSSEVTDWQAYGYLERAAYELDRKFSEAEQKRRRPGRRR